jgi:hypothetical protein
MDITEIKWPARRRRGRYSDEFNREDVKACQAPGVSTASVALANNINSFRVIRITKLSFHY